MLTSVPCVTDKVTLKTTNRIISIMMRDERVCRLHEPSSVLHCLKDHWSLLSDTIHVNFALSGVSLDKHSYTSPKVGHMAPNIL